MPDLWRLCQLRTRQRREHHFRVSGLHWRYWGGTAFLCSFRCRHICLSRCDVPFWWWYLLNLGSFFQFIKSSPTYTNWYRGSRCFGKHFEYFERDLAIWGRDALDRQGQFYEVLSSSYSYRMESSVFEESSDSLSSKQQSKNITLLSNPRVAHL